MWMLHLNSRLSLIIRVSFSRGLVAIGVMEMWTHWHLLRTVGPMVLSVARQKMVLNSIFKQEMSLYLLDCMDPLMPMALEQSESMWIQNKPVSESYHRSVLANNCQSYWFVSLFSHGLFTLSIVLITSCSPFQESKWCNSPSSFLNSNKPSFNGYIFIKKCWIKKDL